MLRSNGFYRHIPNFCTLLNAVCGILALMVAVFHKTQQMVPIACLLILIGGFFDSIDGRLARKLNVSSPLGKELDSFADAITFGIAPVFIFLCMHSELTGNLVTLPEILLATFYIICAVFRLARYNISDHRNFFMGLPSTASGMLLSGLTYIAYRYSHHFHSYDLFSVVSYGVILLLGIAMVSNVKVRRI